MTIEIKRSIARRGLYNGQRETDGLDCLLWIASLLITLSIPGTASAAPSDDYQTRLDDEYALLNWATHLSRYSTELYLPEVQYKPHEFFVEHACLGREDCRVLGWYNDQDIVYVDESLDAMDSLFERSLLVHEFVHVLQHRSGEFNEHDCEKFVEREREAYAVQQAFFVAHGAVPTVRSRHYSCTARSVIAKSVLDKFDEASHAAHSQQSSLQESDPQKSPAVNPTCPENSGSCSGQFELQTRELSGSEK